MLQLAKVAEHRADYYLDDVGGELRRVAPAHAGSAAAWVGRAAADLGLRGRVDEEALRRLLAGAHPGSGRPLVTRRRTVAGFDLTFSAPKSVSLLVAFSSAGVVDETMSAHREAVRAAVGYLERRALSVRRGSGEDRVTLATDGMAAGSFTHFLSRAGDPHLHTHVVAANLAHGVDGRWSALDGRGLYAHARAAGALYDAHLRAELADRLGAEWSRRPRGSLEVDGADPLLLAAFSGRSAEIRQHMATRGLDSPGARRVAWAATRDPKMGEESRRSLPAEWVRRARVAGEWRLERRSTPGGERLDEHRFAASIASGAPSGACRRDAVAAWCDAVGTGGRAEEIEGAVDHWAADPALGVSEARRATASLVPSPHLLRALGPRPAGPQHQPLWRGAAAAIDRYRQRWGVVDAMPLGAEAGRASLSHARLADELEVSRTVREALARMGAGSRSRLEREGLTFERC